MWVVKPEDAAALPPGVEHVAPNTREYFDLIARAGFFVNNVNFPNHLVKREGHVHVMTHHGTPLKPMGLDQQDMSGGRRRGWTSSALLRRCRALGLQRLLERVLDARSGSACTRRAYESLETGYPRNDALVERDGGATSRASGPRSASGPDQVAVLYAPTHREYDEGYVPLLDLAAVAEGLGPDHVLLARLHYFYDADPLLRGLHREGRIIDVAAHPSVEELCLAADVLVTDYSSIMFDYATSTARSSSTPRTGSAYRSVRGTYFDLLERAARPRRQDGGGAGRGVALRRRRAPTRARAPRSGRASARWRTAGPRSASCAGSGSGAGGGRDRACPGRPMTGSADPGSCWSSASAAAARAC